jgi:predicted Zn-dependent protease
LIRFDLHRFAVRCQGLDTRRQNQLSIRVLKLEPPDSHHLDAAIGWLGLGCPKDAREELEKLSVASRNHPVALEVRWAINAKEARWDEALKIAEWECQQRPDDPTGWLHRAYALRRAKAGGLVMAWSVLLPAAEKFPQEPVIAYNLACYACQLKHFNNARTWLQQALRIGEKDTLKKMALADDDLKPLWPEIRLL